jgi:hypothetical protein
MVKLATAGAIAGAWFVVWQLWNMRRKAASTANYDFARAHPGSTRMSPLEVYAAQREANGAPARLLSVSSFSIANLDVSQCEVQRRRVGSGALRVRAATPSRSRPTSSRRCARPRPCLPSPRARCRGDQRRPTSRRPVGACCVLTAVSRCASNVTGDRASWLRLRCANAAAPARLTALGRTPTMARRSLLVVTCVCGGALERHGEP